MSSYSINGRQVIRDEPVYLIEYSKVKDRFTALNDYLISNEPKAVMLRMLQDMGRSTKGHTLSLIRDGESYRVIDTAGFPSPKNGIANNTIYNPKDDFSKSTLYNVYNVNASKYKWQFSSFIVVR